MRYLNENYGKVGQKRIKNFNKHFSQHIPLRVLIGLRRCSSSVQDWFDLFCISLNTPVIRIYKRPEMHCMYIKLKYLLTEISLQVRMHVLALNWC